jgi:ribonuclease HI
MCRHFPKATNNTMELKSIPEALSFLPGGMAVWVSSDSNYVRQGTTNWKRNSRKNGKNGRVTDATLWRKMDTAVARHARVEFAWVKSHSGILLNECADQEFISPGDYNHTRRN